MLLTHAKSNQKLLNILSCSLQNSDVMPVRQLESSEMTARYNPTNFENK
ncbi:hypothetical protein HMPREF9104_02549 [Lentilactobacillus kisonensis F0435]|uniref:Uncharacterized protein n=1 Tax=Lentilactobacillus kisonensis F0435 TaxID=797516 RepID=H1LIV7_9LACO|nr:hypothetical protein HMPREF9104_02549 [Lentilactobacillus kisonensis F0435]